MSIAGLLELREQESEGRCLLERPGGDFCKLRRQPHQPGRHVGGFVMFCYCCCLVRGFAMVSRSFGAD